MVSTTVRVKVVYLLHAHTHTRYNIVLLQAPTQCCYCKQRLDDPLLKVYPGDPDDAVSSIDISHKFKKCFKISISFFKA